MAIAFVNAISARPIGSAGGVTTPPINTSGANFLVAVVADYTDESTVLSDFYGNVGWVGLTQQATALGSAVQIWYHANATCGAGHTFTSTPGGGDAYAAIGVAAFSGVKTSSPFDQQNGATASASTIQAGLVSPGEPGELIIAGLAAGNVDISSISGGFTLEENVRQSGGESYGMGLAYLIQTTAVNVNPTWTVSGSIGLQAAIATFKAATAAPAARTSGLLLGVG